MFIVRSKPGVEPGVIIDSHIKSKVVGAGVGTAGASIFPKMLCFFFFFFFSLLLSAHFGWGTVKYAARGCLT